MKKMNRLFLLAAVLLFAASCSKVSYKKTASGLVYKLFPSDSKDSLLRDGQIAKIEATAKLNDSVIFTTYGRVPVYLKMQPMRLSYNITEILRMMKKGDSAVCVQMADSLLKKGGQLPANAKKGDRITTTMRIVEVYNSDSIAQADYNAAMERDRPRQLKEEQEEMEKMKKNMKEQEEKKLAELEKSGEMVKQEKQVQDYLAAKKISAQRTGMGTYVEVKSQGTGPLPVDGKYVMVQYTGRILRNDSTFESATYPLRLGEGRVIAGWEEGLKLFNKGASGTIYIPGYRAYGDHPPAGSPFGLYEALIFDVTIKDISDTMPPMPQEQPGPSRQKNN